MKKWIARVESKEVIDYALEGVSLWDVFYKLDKAIDMHIGKVVEKITYRVEFKEEKDNAS